MRNRYLIILFVATLIIVSANVFFGQTDYWTPKNPPKATYIVEAKFDVASNAIVGTENVKFENKYHKPISVLCFLWWVSEDTWMKVSVDGQRIEPLEGSQYPAYKLPVALQPGENLAVDIEFRWGNILRVSPLSGQKRGLFKVHFVPALNDFIVSTILSKNRSSESLYIQRSLSSPCSYLYAKTDFCADGNPK